MGTRRGFRFLVVLIPFLESVFSPKSLDHFYWRMILTVKIWMVNVSINTGILLFLDPLADRARNCVYTNLLNVYIMVRRQIFIVFFFYFILIVGQQFQILNGNISSEEKSLSIYEWKCEIMYLLLHIISG